MCIRDRGRLCLVDRWDFEVPRTKDAVAALEALGVEGNALVVLGPEDAVAERSFANLASVDLGEADQLTAYDVLVNDWVIFTEATLPGENTATAAPAPKPAKAAATTKKAPAKKKPAQAAAKRAAPEEESAKEPVADVAGAEVPDDSTETEEEK